MTEADNDNNQTPVVNDCWSFEKINNEDDLRRAYEQFGRDTYSQDSDGTGVSTMVPLFDNVGSSTDDKEDY